MNSSLSQALITEYNPNYLFGAEEISALKVALMKLNQIPHANIKLIRPLGKGKENRNDFNFSMGCTVTSQ